MASSLTVFILLLASLLPIHTSRKMDVGAKENRHEVIRHISNLTTSERFNPSKTVHVSWHPRMFSYVGFLSDKECDHLISLAQKKLASRLSSEHGLANGTSVHIGPGTLLVDDQVARIEERISAWTFLPKENGELLVHYYKTNENYEPQYDYDQDKSGHSSSEQPFATLIMYLSDVILGGETVFPKSEQRTTQPKDGTWSKCAENKYGVKPARGSAILYFHLHPDATSDESSLRDECTVLEGEKWTATKHIHTGQHLGKEGKLASGMGCTDEDENCSHWAATGECQRNPSFMLGSPDYYGACRKSCGVC